METQVQQGNSKKKISANAIDADCLRVTHRGIPEQEAQYPEVLEGQVGTPCSSTGIHCATALNLTQTHGEPRHSACNEQVVLEHCCVGSDRKAGCTATAQELGRAEWSDFNHRLSTKQGVGQSAAPRGAAPRGTRCQLQTLWQTSPLQLQL